MKYNPFLRYISYIVHFLLNYNISTILRAFKPFYFDL